MPPIHVAVLAVLSGVTEALAVSPSGHAAVARVWIEPGATAQAQAAMALGAAIGLVVAAWRRLSGAAGEGMRAIARPAVFGGSQAAHDARTIVIGVAVSVFVSSITFPHVEAWAGSPTAAGLGLCVTGIALASTQLVPALAAHGARAGRSGPSIAAAAIVGAAHGFAVFPGASRVGAALTVLLWIGVHPVRAIDLAFLLTAPALLIAFVRDARGGLPTTTLALAISLSFVSALFASEGLRALAPRRRFGALALWILPLGLALLAYARALRPL